MRLFMKQPKQCDSISFSYNHLKPEEGIIISLGIGEDEKLPGLPVKDVAYHRIEVSELEWFINKLQEIKSGYDAQDN